MKVAKRRTKRRGRVPQSRARRTLRVLGDTRRYPRAETEWDVTLEVPGSRAKKGKLSGLSPFGGKLRLRPKQPGPPEGTTIQLRFVPSRGESPLTIKGLVWRTDSDGQAIVFVNLSTQDFQRLKSLVNVPTASPAY